MMSDESRMYAVQATPLEWSITFDYPFPAFMPFLDQILASMMSHVRSPAKRMPGDNGGYDYSIDHPSGLFIATFSVEPAGDTTALRSGYTYCSVPVYYDNFFRTLFQHLGTLSTAGAAPPWFVPYAPVDLTKKTHSASPGRRKLEQDDPDDYIDRLALAQEAEEIRRKNPSATWKQIAITLHCPLGSDNAGLMALKRSRDALKTASSETLVTIARQRTQKQEQHK